MSILLDKKNLNKFFEGSLSMKDKHELNIKIINRFDEIIQYLYNKFGDYNYWTFDSLAENESGVGAFTNKYKNNIDYIIEGKNVDKYNGKYINQIPTRWLIEDYKEELDKEIKAILENEESIQKEKRIEKEKLKDDNEKRVNNIEKIIELQKSIMSKLTIEEKSILSFKQFMEISPDLNENLKMPNLPKESSGKIERTIVNDYLKNQNLNNT